MRKKGRGAKGECAPGGAEGMRVGSGGQRTPFPGLGHRGPNQLRCPAAGRISTPPHRAGGHRTTGGQCLPPVSRQEGGGGHGAGGPAERCQVPWEASMAPAVSWKSRSCCRKRMACVGEKMGPRRPRAGPRGQAASHYAPPPRDHSRARAGPGVRRRRGAAHFAVHAPGWLSGKGPVCRGREALHCPSCH